MQPLDRFVGRAGNGNHVLGGFDQRHVQQCCQATTTSDLRSCPVRIDGPGRLRVEPEQVGPTGIGRRIGTGDTQALLDVPGGKPPVLFAAELGDFSQGILMLVAAIVISEERFSLAPSKTSINAAWHASYVPRSATTRGPLQIAFSSFSKSV